jgi:hypothetical protein
VAVLTPPGYVQAGVYSALLDRMYLATMRTMREAATNNAAREGFFPDRVSAYSNPSGMDVVIGPGSGIIANDFAGDAGDYLFANTSNTTLTPAASSPTQNRHDILGFQVKDNFYDGSGQNALVPTIVQGANAAGAPSDPATPSSFIPVVRAVINAGVTSPTLQDLRVKTVNSGGILPVESATVRGTLGNSYPGAAIWRTDVKRVELADGVGGWSALTVPVVSTVAGLSTFTSPYADMVAWVTEVKGLYVYSGGTWQHVRSAEPSGKLWSTAGDQAIGAGASATIVMNQSRVRGGVVATPASGTLSIPVSGFYRVNYGAPVDSGGSGRIQASVERVRAGSPLMIHATGEYKEGTVTFWLTGQSPEVPLQAGDTVRLAVLNSTASSMNVSRLTEVNSAFLALRYVRSLEGATPV